MVAFGLLTSSCSRSHCWTQSLQVVLLAVSTFFELAEFSVIACNYSNRLAVLKFNMFYFPSFRDDLKLDL